VLKLRWVYAPSGPQGFDHPDNAALTVAISVLNAMESYLWKAIRGTGLAYGTSVAASAETGHVFLNIYRSPDCAVAFREARRVVQDLVDKKVFLSHHITFFFFFFSSFSRFFSSLSAYPLLVPWLPVKV
jgi:Zn-dependent M16 (insulinase) family peptidase